MARAALTGMGLTSQKREWMSSRLSTCARRAASTSPARKDAHMSWTVLGATSAQTEMTPTAPRLMSGTTMSSLPLIMWKSSERQWAMSAA